MALASDSNELLIDDVDPDLMQKWVEQAAERAGDLRLELWIGPYPEDELEKIAEMKQIMNTAPTDELDIEDSTITPEQLRKTDDSLEPRGVERWTMAVRDPQNKHFAGYTEVFWKASEPDRLGQGETGVVPEYRGRGIGRWLKAAMIQKVMLERPEVKKIRTDNASSNRAMLKVNHEMGFKLRKTWKNWQIECDQVREYLAWI